MDVLAAKGSDLFLNLSASPFTLSKNEKRHRMLSAKLSRLHLPMLYVNRRGLENNGKTCYTFDGMTAAYGKDGRLLAALLVFGVPLTLIGLSAAIGYLWIKKEIFVLVLSLIFLLLWYTILAVIDKKLQKLSGFSWKIVEIYQKGGEDGDKRDNGGDGVL